MEGKKATFKVIDNGPLLVQGDFEVFDGKGKKLEVPGDRIYFCRCKRSSNMPFCDGTHKRPE